jgi:hypothetical protein
MALVLGKYFSKDRNLDLNEPILKPVNFDDHHHLEGPSSTPTDVALGLDTLEEAREHSVSGSVSGGDADDFDYEIQEDEL